MTRILVEVVKRRYRENDSFFFCFFFQICGNVEGQQVLLNTPRTLEPYLFSKLMTVREIRERITLQPQAPCLNLK